LALHVHRDFAQEHGGALEKEIAAEAFGVQCSQNVAASMERALA